MCHFPSSNIFRKSLVDFWTSKYIRIFVWKFLEIWIYSNICSKPHFNIFLSMFIKQCEYWSNLGIKMNIRCKTLFRGPHVWAFFKSYYNQWKVKIFGYLNQIAWSIIRIHIFAISRVQIYLDICLVNMWHPNIFRYLFCKLCGIQIYSNILYGPFYDIRSSLDWLTDYPLTDCSFFLPNALKDWI